MSRRLGAAAVAIAILVGSASPSWADARTRRRIVNASLTVGSGFLFLGSETVLEDRLKPDRCRWCNPPSVDVAVRDALLWDDPTTARTASNIIGYVLTPAFSLGLVALGSAQSTGSVNVWDELVPIVETVAISQLFVQGAKFAVGRERPLVHYGVPVSQDDNVSFFSGHSALAFAVVTSAGVIAHERSYATEKYIWAIGMPLAATTAYLRIAGDKHYFTDVLTGSVFGVAAGIVIPKLARKLPVDIAPTPNGVTILGMW